MARKKTPEEILAVIEAQPRLTDLSKEKLLHDLISDDRKKEQETVDASNQDKDNETGQPDTESQEQAEPDETSAETTSMAEAQQILPTRGVDCIERYAEENELFEHYATTLGMVFCLLRNHFKQEGKRPTLLDHLGFNERILMKYLIAIFGYKNPHLQNKKGGAIRALITSSTKFKNILFKVLKLDGLEYKDIKTQLNRLMERMEPLEQLLSIKAKELHKIAKTIKALKLPEEDEMPSKEQREKAEDCGLDYTDPRDLSEDEKILDQMIAENQEGASNASGQEPNSGSGEGQSAKRDSIPQKKKRAPQQKKNATDTSGDGAEKAAEKLESAINRLKKLFAHFKDPSIDSTDLALDIDETEVGQDELLGTSLITAARNSQADVRQFLKKHFKLDGAELEAKILEIDDEFRKKKIYPK